LDGLFSFGYASNGSLAVGCWLADLNTAVDGLAKGTLSVILGSLEKKNRMVFGMWEIPMFGGSFVTEKVQIQDHRI
jgi:hypothetical protein